MRNPTRSRKTKGVQPRLLHAVVRRMAMVAELAWNEIGGLAADLNVAVCGGTYEQHCKVMIEQMDRADAIRAKYAPNDRTELP